MNQKIIKTASDLYDLRTERVGFVDVGSWHLGLVIVEGEKIIFEKTIHRSNYKAKSRGNKIESAFQFAERIFEKYIIKFDLKFIVFEDINFLAKRAYYDEEQDEFKEFYDIQSFRIQMKFAGVLQNKCEENNIQWGHINNMIVKSHFNLVALINGRYVLMYKQGSSIKERMQELAQDAALILDYEYIPKSLNQDSADAILIAKWFIDTFYYSPATPEQVKFHINKL